VSGFSAEWLGQREPADRVAVNAGLRQDLVRLFAGRDRITVVDLGSGTGSNLRNLGTALGGRQCWRLVDNNACLLERATSPDLAILGATGEPVEIETRIADFSRGDFAPLLRGADLVTASALFDLVSAPVIERLAAAVTAPRQVFYSVLTYDGIAAWLPEHPADEAMREAFNRHQRTDKGFGPAEGPAATERLATAFARHDYAVLRGKSPWILDGNFAVLRCEVDRGWAEAVRRTGLLAGPTLDAWLAHRLTPGERVTIVGHEDLLAYPKERVT
jgi:hypothetical protein